MFVNNMTLINKSISIENQINFVYNIAQVLENKINSIQ